MMREILVWIDLQGSVEIIERTLQRPLAHEYRSAIVEGHGRVWTNLERKVEVRHRAIVIALLNIGPAAGDKMGGRLRCDLEARIEGRNAKLVRAAVATANGIEIRYWLLFGNASASALVAGHYPVDREKEFDALIRSVVLSAKWDISVTPDILKRLPFTITPPPPLKLAGVEGDKVIYSEMGSMRPLRLGVMSVVKIFTVGKPA